MKKKLISYLLTIISLVALVLSSFASLVSAQEPIEGGTFVVGIGREPETYNPNAAPNDAAKAVIENVMNKLLKINGYSQIVPDLAESYEFSEDGLKLTFHLHEGVKWHDGEDLTADDVKWTFDQIMAEQGFASYALGALEEVQVVDEVTLDFILSEPDAGILGAIAWHGTQIMPEHLYAGTDWLTNETNQHPIGTGPFKFVEHIPGESILLEANEDYFKDGPYLEEVILQILPDSDVAYQAWLNGEIDENRLGVPAEEIDVLAEDDEYVVTETAWPNMASIVFNMQEGIFTDPLLREAVMYGIDAEEIYVKNYKENGSVAEYFIPYQYDWALNDDAMIPGRDVEKARALIEEAGYEADEEGFYFETTIDTYPGWDNLVPILAQNLAEIGIKLNHNSMDDGTYDEKVLEQEDFELTALAGYIGPDISAIENRFGTDKAMNYGLYSSEEMDALLKAGRQEVDQEKRAEIYRDVQTLLREDLPVVFFWNNGGRLVTKAYVKGHPMADPQAREINGEIEFTNVWLDNE